MCIYMHVCTYTHLYIHIYFTACGPPKYQRVMSGRRNQVFNQSINACGLFFSLHISVCYFPSFRYGIILYACYLTEGICFDFI